MWSIRGYASVSIHLADVETGQILWSSETVSAEAYIHWSEALTRFWRYPLVGLGYLVGVIVVLLIVRKIIRGVKHATRPL